jgi:hypothetical protein
MSEVKNEGLEVVAGTPSSKWLAAGEQDPHGDRYSCERAALAMGGLTDDELANSAFMNYDQPLNLAGIMAGTHSSPIAWMTAVKDRIRWLSRINSEALAGYAVRDARIAELERAVRERQEPVLQEIRDALGDQSIANFGQVATGIRDLCDQLRAELADLEYDLEQITDQNIELQSELAAVRAAPAPAVVMPERKPVSVRIITGTQYYNAFDDGFNTCLDEYTRLNAVQASPSNKEGE